MITLGKISSVANRRLAYSRLRDREMVGKLFDDIGVRFKDRSGGYMRILKTGFRHGDSAPMALVQLTERQASASPVAATADAAPVVESKTKAKKPQSASAPKKKTTKTKKKTEAAAE